MSGNWKSQAKALVANPSLFDTGAQAEEIRLRDYQIESIEQLRENIRNGVNSQILASMVGSGKTVMAAYLLHECWQKGNPGVFVVDRLSLLGQTSATFDRYGIPHGIIQSNHPRHFPNELIQIASIQTVMGREWPKASLIIIDEAHVVHRTTTRKIAENDAKVIGLTATPFTPALGRHYKAIVNVRTGNQLTAEGHMVPFRVWAAAEPDMKGAKVVAGEWTDKEASERSIRIVGDVVKEYMQHGEGRKSICFGTDVAHCEELKRQFVAAGIDARLYTYLTGDEEREELLREFRKPDSFVRLLISVSALSRGFDVPDVGCIIMCRPLKSSFAEFVQILGRGLRPHSSKSDCIVLDLAGNFMRHYGRLVEFFEIGCHELDDGKKKDAQDKQKQKDFKPPLKCPKCGYLPVKDKVCGFCGFEFHFETKRNEIIHEAGELGEFDLKSRNVAKAGNLYIADILKSYNRTHKPASPGFIRFIQRLGIPLGQGPFTASQLYRIRERFFRKHPEIAAKYNKSK